MSELIQNYPKSSCTCYGCANKVYKFNDYGFPLTKGITFMIGWK